MSGTLHWHLMTRQTVSTSIKLQQTSHYHDHNYFNDACRQRSIMAVHCPAPSFITSMLLFFMFMLYVYVFNVHV